MKTSTSIKFQNKSIPVYIEPSVTTKSNAVSLLVETLNRKFISGKKAVKKCLETLVSIEIIGCEAILHSKREFDSLAISLY
jgi:hypothetical protein